MTSKAGGGEASRILGWGPGPWGRMRTRWGRGGGVAQGSGTVTACTPPIPGWPLGGAEKIPGSPCPCLRRTRGGDRPSQPLALTCGHRCMRWTPRSASGGVGREAPYSHPPWFSPPPAASAAAAAGALCCNARAAAAAEPARAPVAPVTATPPGAARRAAVLILSPAPSPGAAPPAQSRRGAAEAGGCVAAVTRYAGPPPGTRVAGGREVRQACGSGGGAEAWSLASDPLPGSSSGPHSPRPSLVWRREACPASSPATLRGPHSLSPPGSQRCATALSALPWLNSQSSLGGLRCLIFSMMASDPTLLCDSSI